VVAGDLEVFLDGPEAAGGLDQGRKAGGQALGYVTVEERQVSGWVVQIPAGQPQANWLTYASVIHINDA
jgi:hypothetical protein